MLNNVPFKCFNCDAISSQLYYAWGIYTRGKEKDAKCWRCDAPYPPKNPGNPTKMIDETGRKLIWKHTGEGDFKGEWVEDLEAFDRDESEPATFFSAEETQRQVDATWGRRQTSNSDE